MNTLSHRDAATEFLGTSASASEGIKRYVGTIPEDKPAESSDPIKQEWGQPPFSHLNPYVVFLMSSGEVVSGVYVTSPVMEIDIIADDDQAWFWTPEWQAKEQEADEDLRLGRYTDYDNIDDFISSL